MRHKHADVIIAWAEGEEIEWREGISNKWKPVNWSNPSFGGHMEYRIKPKPEEIWEPTMELRNVRIGATDLYKLQQKWVSGNGTANNPFKVEWRDVPIVSEEK